MADKIPVVLLSVGSALVGVILGTVISVYVARWEVRAGLLGSEKAGWEDVLRSQSELAGNPNDLRLNHTVALERELDALKAQRDLHNVLARRLFRSEAVSAERDSITFMINNLTPELEKEVQQWHVDAKNLHFSDSEQRSATVRLLAMADWSLHHHLYKTLYDQFNSEIPTVADLPVPQNSHGESGKSLPAAH